MPKDAPFFAMLLSKTQKHGDLNSIKAALEMAFLVFKMYLWGR